MSGPSVQSLSRLSRAGSLRFGVCLVCHAHSSLFALQSESVDDLVARQFQLYLSVLERVLSQPIASGLVSQWEHEHVNQQTTWPKLRLACLRCIKAAIDDHRAELEHALKDRMLDTSVAYYPVDRLYVVTACLPLRK